MVTQITHDLAKGNCWKKKRRERRGKGEGKGRGELSVCRY